MRKFFVFAAALLVLGTLAPLMAQNAPAVPQTAPVLAPIVIDKAVVEPYGYFKMDMSWDDSLVNTGNYATWVLPENVMTDHHAFNLTANESRFGLKVKGPGTEKMKVRGQVEADFYGGTVENKATPMMRHAYLELSWPELDVAVLGGQTSDLIAPLNPTTLDYTVLWWAGNIGYRRPQLRVTKGFGSLEGQRVELAMAAARTIGSTADSGPNAGFPTTQVRMAWSFPMLEKKRFEVGLSGHFGQEEVDSALGVPAYYRTSSGVLDMTMPLLSNLTLKGEGWMGENLSAYLGGIGQGILAGKIVRSNGGWAQFGWDAASDMHLNLVGGIDAPNPQDLTNTKTDKTQNYVALANVICDLAPNTSVGLEVSYWNTEYRESALNADALRLQSSMKYAF